MLDKRTKRSNYRRESAITAVLFLASAIIMLKIWGIYPMIQTFLALLPVLAVNTKIMRRSFFHTAFYTLYILSDVAIATVFYISGRQ